MDNMIWYCVKAMLLPFWVPIKNVAPVTTFNWAKAIQAVQDKEGHTPFAGDVMAEQTHRVQIQAHHMAQEHARTQERLAKKEAAQALRDEECRRQAQRDKEAIGQFEL